MAGMSNPRLYSMASTTKHLHSLGYGQFPYLLVRNAPSLYTQIPIILDYSPEMKEGIIIILDDYESMDELIDKVFMTWVDIINGKPVFTCSRLNSNVFNLFSSAIICPIQDRIQGEACLVTSEESCYYFQLEHPSINYSNSIPKGGELQTIRFEKIQFPENNHFMLKND